MTTLKPRFNTRLVSRSDIVMCEHAWNDLRRIPSGERLADDFVRLIDAVQHRVSTATDTAGRRSSDISDPTAMLALSFITIRMPDEKDPISLADLCQRILQARHALLVIERALIACGREADAVTLAQAVDAARCAGMGKPGYAAWGDETCTELEVVDGICGKCVPHRLRWLKDPTYRRPVDRRFGARLPTLEVVDHGKAAGAAKLIREAARIVPSESGVA